MIKRQLEKVDEVEEGGANPNAKHLQQEFVNLINLSAIAEKSKEERIRKMEMLRLKKDEKKIRPIPFYIDWVIKEDLEVVLKQ
jgi:hypothetical protein